MTPHRPPTRQRPADCPPAASDAELALLAAVIVDPTRMDTVEIVGADFADAELGGLFDALRLLHDAGLPICEGLTMPGTLARWRRMWLRTWRPGPATDPR